MRISHSNQGRLDCEPIQDVSLNLECRDEIIPVLYALQHIYQNPHIRDEVLKLVGDDVNSDTSSDRGREGLSYWEILVLASLRLGCNLDYDRLQDLAENHRKLRAIMGIGDWDEREFNWKRIRDNVCYLTVETIEKISQLIVTEGHLLDSNAAIVARADSFVVESNIHYPTESSLIYDGVRKIIEIISGLTSEYDMEGWRQHAHLLRKVKKLHANIGRRSRSKSEETRKAIEGDYKELLKIAASIVDRAEMTAEQLKEASGGNLQDYVKAERIHYFIRHTRTACNTAYRRVILGETVPNEDKIFSIFEPHTQLYRRGKAGQENQFGRMVVIFEDGVGFITHCQLLARTEQDVHVTVPQAKLVQEKLHGKVERMSFDRGFYSEENARQLEEIVSTPCLPKNKPSAYAEQMANATVEFREARKWHSGIESAIGALQSGNGLTRCRDRTEVGFERYLHIAVLGRNLHVLGKMLIASQAPDSLAATTLRRAA